MTEHKTSHSKFKKTKIITSIFSDHSGMKLEINNNRTDGKSTNMLKLSDKLANNQSK